MGKSHCRTENPPVTLARRPFGIAVIGCPTVVIDIAGTGSSPTRVRPAGRLPVHSARPGPAVPASVLANPTSSCSATTVIEVPRNSGLPPARMAGRLSEHMEKVWEQFTPRAELAGRRDQGAVPRRADPRPPRKPQGNERAVQLRPHR